MSNNTPSTILPPNPFGTDLFVGPNAAGTLDLDPVGRLVSGRDVLSQRLICRQTTPRGTVIDVPNSCFDVRGWMSQGLTSTQLSQLAGNIKAELMQDEGVTSAAVTVNYNTETSKLVIVESIESTYGPLKLTLTIDKLTGQLLVSDQGT